MNQHAGALVLGVMAVLALGPTFVALRRARAFGDWDSTATFVFGVAILPSLATVGSALVHGRTVVLDDFGTVVPGLPAAGILVDQLASGLLLAAGLVFAVHRFAGGRTRINAAPVIALVLCVVLALSDGLNGHQIFATRQLVLVAVLAAAAAARPGRPAALGAAAGGLLLALLGGFQALLHEDSVFRDCRADKCGPFGWLFNGVFPNENTYGLPLALSIPFVWMAFRGRGKIVLVLYVAFMAFVTGSRLSEIAAVAALVCLVALRPGRKTLAAVGVAVAAVAGLVLPVLADSPDALSDRGHFWQIAIERLAASPIHGFGAKAWEGLYETGQIPLAGSYSPHNQWLDVLYAGGLIGLIVFVVLLGRILLQGDFVTAACVVIPVLVASSMERPWSFGISDWITFSLVAATLVTSSTRPAPRPAGAVSVPSSDPAPAHRPGH
jgi:hypothetical protein